MGLVAFLKHPPLHEPSRAQKEAGNYSKRKIAWRGMEISIENEAGSMRRGTNRDGGTWEQRMSHPYGYLRGTEGVDGDHVDVFVGPNMDAPTVYVVHARKVNRWDQYDEDKCMLGFNSADEAKQAFLDNYSDPRFFGDMVEMPVDEFLTKVKATADEPAMIKAQQLSLFDEVTPVAGSVKADGTVVKPYTRVQKKARKPATETKSPSAETKPVKSETKPPKVAPEAPKVAPIAEKAVPAPKLGQFGAIGESKAERRRINAEVVHLLGAGKTEYTADEKALLARYSGNGGCGDSLNEFYTDPAVATAMWTALDRLGVSHGAALEPSCGTGVFLHTAPADVKVTGVEIDPVSAKVAAILHDRHEVRDASMERFATSDERQFQAVVGNAPFGIRGGTIKDDKPDVTRADTYFIDAALDKTAAGGVVAMIVHHGVLDSARDRAMRERFLTKAEFLGAIRMPNTAFEHSHTEVTSDIVFFRKRPQDVANALGTLTQEQLKALSVWDDEYLAGDYFEGRGSPNILGVVEPGWRAKAGMGNDITVAGSMQGVPEHIAEWGPDDVPRGTPGMHDILNMLTEDPAAKARALGAAIRIPYELTKAGSVKTVDGIQYLLEGDPLRWHRMDEVMDRPAVTEGADLARRVDRMMQGFGDREDIAAEINAYIAKYGNPGKNADLLTAAGQDRSLYKLIGAVHTDGTLSDLFKPRAAAPISTFETAAQTIAVENADGLFTPEEIAARTGKDIETVEDMLYASSDYAITPAGRWTTMDQFLSGEMWPKLDAIKAALERSDVEPSIRAKYELEAKRLDEAIDPKSLEDVDVAVNHAFIPLDVVTAYFNDRKNESDNDWIRKQDDMKISYGEGVYAVTGGRYPHGDLLERYLNRSGVKKDEWDDITKMNADFKNWLISSRFRDQVETLYNRKFRGYIAPAFSNAPIDIPGMNTEGLKQYQYGGARWALAHGGGIIAADVGLGKTVRALMIARLAKLQGTAARNMIVVPKSVIANWAKEAERWFPGSRVLTIGETVIGDKSRADTAAERNHKLHEYLQNDYDFVFISQPAFNDLDVDPETKKKYTDDDFWVQRGDKLGNAGDKRVRAIRESYEQHIAKRDFEKRTDALYFNDLGVDLLMADEAHCFPAGTLIDGRPIETYKSGDMVRSYDHVLNRVVMGRVANLQIRRPVDLYRVTIDGQPIICTGKHPFFTQRGYVFAKDLISGDLSYKNLYDSRHETEESMAQRSSSACNSDVEMQSLQCKIQAQQMPRLASSRAQQVAFLLQQIVRHVLEAYSANAAEIYCSGQCAQIGGFQAGVAETSIDSQSDAQSSDTRESKRHIKSNGVQAGNSWWKRTWAYCASTVARQCAELADGSRRFRSAAAEWSLLHIQNRYWQSRTKDCDRSRWQESQFTKTTPDRSSQREGLIECRVDHIEIFKQTSDGTFGAMCPSGLVYNIEVERYHNYFAEDVLVHNSYKNLFAVRNRFGQSPKFLGGGGLSNRVLDMQMKARAVRDAHGGKGVFSLTATPTKNSPLEIYSMLMHVAPQVFDDVGIRNSEEFLDRFCEFATGPCLQTDGTIEDSLYVSGFKNMDELRTLMRKHIDRQTAEDVGLVLPKRDDRMHMVDMSDEQKSVYTILREQAEESSGKDATGDAHIFSIMDKMGKAALDLELLGPEYAGARSPKYAEVSKEVSASVKDGGQIVFCEAIKAHDKIKDSLVAAGIPENEIAIFNAQTAKTGDARQKIQDQFNAGKLKVVIGNKTMEEGVNLQKGTADIHHMDIAWEPATMQQRNGRGLRQGNINEAVRIHSYLSKGSFDGYRYQAVMAKKSWQDILWKGGDKIENLERPTLTRDEVMVMMSADPDAARAKMDANHALAEERYLASKTSAASDDFMRFQTMKHSYAALKNKKSDAAERLRIRMAASKEKLKENKFFKAKAALDTDNLVLLHPDTGTVLQHGAGIEREGKKWVVASVNPLEQTVTMRSFGAIGKSAHMVTLPVAEMGDTVKPFDYHEKEETAEISKQFAADADAVVDMKSLRNIPHGVIAENYKAIQDRLKSGLHEYKWSVGSHRLPYFDAGEAKTAETYEASKIGGRADLELMLPTPEHRERAIAEYIKAEQGKELRSETPSYGGRSRHVNTAARLVAKYPTGEYGGTEVNPWESAGKLVFGNEFSAEAHTAFEKQQQQAMQAAPTFAEALRAAAPTVKASYSGPEWPQSTIAILFAKAKHEGILENRLADMVPKRGYPLAIDYLHRDAWKIQPKTRHSKIDVRDLPVAEAFIQMATAHMHYGLAAAMIVSSNPANVAASKLMELPMTHEAVIASIAHLADKHPDLAAMKVSNFISEHEINSHLGYGHADTTFGELADMLHTRAGIDPVEAA